MTKRRRPTPAQDALLTFIIEYKIANDGLLPSYAEMAQRLGISTNAAYQAALRLVGRGKLKFNHNRKLILGGTYVPPQD